MRNAYAISSLARQLCKASERLESFAMGCQEMSSDYPDISEVYQGLMLDEVEHVQILTLELTKLITESVSEDTENNADGDGGVFGPGELTAKKPGENGDGGDSEKSEEDE